MKALKFTLSGNTAFFKKPDVNTNVYFTFGHIHKVALLGLFGAALGYGGYIQKKWIGDNGNDKNKQLTQDEYPEFYEKLNGLNVSIVPTSKDGNENVYIPKKIHVFNNSTGTASDESGGNLIVREQWLDHPRWDIYVLLDCEEAEKLAIAFKESKFVYYPYLGKNDHMANIVDVEIVDVESVEPTTTKIDSLFVVSNTKIKQPSKEDYHKVYKYKEALPIRLNQFTNLYEYETFCYTNCLVTVNNDNVYKADNRTLMFY